MEGELRAFYGSFPLFSVLLQLRCEEIAFSIDLRGQSGN